MPSSKKISVVLSGRKYHVSQGSTVADLMKTAHYDDEKEVLGAIVNNRIESVGFVLSNNSTVEPLTYRSREGALIYRRSVCLMLYEVFYSLFPHAHIAVGQSLSEGYYFQVTGVEADDGFLEKIRHAMREMVKEHREFRRWVVSVDEAEELFRNTGRRGKYALIRTLSRSNAHLVSLGDFIDIQLGPVSPHTGLIRGFEIVPLYPDFILRFPDPGLSEVPRITSPQPGLYKAHTESTMWCRRLGVEHVGQLNRLCIDGGISDLIKIAEGFHEKKIADIADRISKKHKTGTRLVMIAGPSSAGKTTFTKRLSIQLRVNGLEPVALSMDDYYVDREKTPKNHDGRFDFEALEAIDLRLFNRHLGRLLEGEPVRTPRFDFNAGKRAQRSKWRTLNLKKDQVMLVEGMHGLNPRLTRSVDARQKYGIYVNALTQLSIDRHNRILTSDTRLIRRIIRDRFFRGYTTAQTIAGWEAVREGERKYIYPYQELADVMFNSALIYEPAVMRVFAERFLLEVPRENRSYTEAYRLLKFIELFVPVFLDEVPHTSILREFVGGSSFRY